jgi:hypothetical protein
MGIFNLSNLKVLIISNNALSSTNSNGRTIYNLFSNLSNEQIANFYVRNEIPDCDKFTNFYRVSDQDVLKAFKKHVKVGGVIKPSTNNIASFGTNSNSNKSLKNPFGSIAREIIWHSKRWISKEFINWLNAFSPNVVFMAAGDAPFLFDIARKISKKRNIPLVIYNSEDYFFKKYNYMGTKYNWLYPLFHHLLLRSMRKAIKQSELCIYNSKTLMNDYLKMINHHAITIYNSSEISYVDRKRSTIENINYLGNLGLDRYKSLIEIGKVLAEHNLVLNVYGPSDKTIKNALDSAIGISYKGMVAYEEVKNIISKSDLLVHVESFTPYALKDLKHAFSTKIADYLSSGVPTFIYSPKGMVSTDYLLEHIEDFIATNDVELYSKLINIINGVSHYPDKEVKKLVKDNHGLKTNQTLLDDELIKIIK